MNKHAIKSGVILGVIGIVLNLLAYIVDPTLFAAWWFGIIQLVLAIFLVSYFGIQHRKEVGGFMSFGQGWVYSFQVFIVSGILGMIFNLLLNKVIDPELPSIVIEAQMANQEAMLSNFGMPEDQMDEALEQTRASFEDAYTVGGMVKAFLFLCIFYAVGSLITGAIIKKKEPELEV